MLVVQTTDFGCFCLIWQSNEMKLVLYLFIYLLVLLVAVAVVV